MLDDLQMKTLEALVDTIIPPDDFPGGWEAGVGDYLLRQFDGDLAEMLPGYRRFLDLLERDARSAHGESFAAIRPQERAAILQELEKQHVPEDNIFKRLKTADNLKDQEGSAFFAGVIEHCGEGYYSDPGNGGNRDGVGGRMVGFEVTA